MSAGHGPDGEPGHGRHNGHHHSHVHGHHGPEQGPVDPDVDLHVPAQRAEAAGRHGLLVLAVIGAGGALGAVGRYALSLWLPAHGPAGFPWGIFVVNVSGCALIGVLMALVAEDGRDARAPVLLRPFLGVGVLGGFTTFSAYASDALGLLRAGPHAPHAAMVAAAYLAGTLLAAIAAVWTGAAVTRALLEAREEREAQEVRER
ncbi:protein CrcB [Streptomyces sp. Amel2xB2]|uniref:fluoride efflux transporter FluC n=1 Tax=Streptomyces sp. Amel2xB2 TaxID=1305829 RepID=UPI000DBACDEA|nr:protein CrcB [Streptomyces sp. Amel2xB2]